MPEGLLYSTQCPKGFYAIQCLKGISMIAQGNALGKGIANSFLSPKGAR
jgi:hypothetical protein